ncbi:hypothetical protein ACFX2G_041960 [Malus domestica]
MATDGVADEWRPPPQTLSAGNNGNCVMRRRRARTMAMAELKLKLDWGFEMLSKLLVRLKFSFRELQSRGTKFPRCLSAEPLTSTEVAAPAQLGFDEELMLRSKNLSSTL